VATGIGT